MESIGETLRALREERELTLEELSVKLKIAVRYLEAIEEDRLQVLPGKTYVTSFIRSFAAEVGLDPEQALRIYHREKIETGEKDDVLWSDEPEESTRAEMPTRLIWTAAAVAIIAVAAYFFLGR